MNITNQKTFQSHLKNIEENNFHSSYNLIYDKFPKNIKDMNNLVLYGPCGIGKYTQSLNIIKRYSKSNLNYEKKITIPFNGKDYLFKISDIHIEIDMDLLGCNAKILWNEIYNQIVDIVHIKPNKTFIILCKNFHSTDNELLEQIYDYMYNFMSNINLIYIFLTEHISFLPKNIINRCNIISFKRPMKKQYKHINNSICDTIKTSDIKNIKNIEYGITELMTPNKKVCEKIIQLIENKNKPLDLFQLRENLYDILTYQLDIGDCIFDILFHLNKHKKITQKNNIELNEALYTFFQYYNNNYRPIFHLERLMLCIYKLIHE